MIKITDNATLNAYIEKQLEPHKTLLDREIAKTVLIDKIKEVSGLSIGTIRKATEQRRDTIAASRYALIQSAIDDGRLPA